MKEFYPVPPKGPVYSIRFADGSFVSRSNGSRLAFASRSAAVRRLHEMRRQYGAEPLSTLSRVWDEALVVAVRNGQVVL